MTDVTQFLILAAIDIAGLFAIWFALRSRVRRYLELGNLLSGVREEARALITEMNETADRNVSLVEDRMTSLRELLDEADRRMGLVRRELGTRAAEREVYARLSKRRPIVPSDDRAEAPPAPRAGRAAIATPPASSEAAVEPAAPPVEAGSAPALSAAGRAAPDAPDAEAVGGEVPVELLLGSARGAPAGGVPEVRVSEERIVAAQTLRERAIDLHRKGFSAQIIAARVGATVAEIELMIEMEEMRPADR